MCFVSGLLPILWHSIHNAALHRWDLFPATDERSEAATPLLGLIWVTTLCYWTEIKSLSKILYSVEITRWLTQSRQSITPCLTLSAFQCPSSGKWMAILFKSCQICSLNFVKFLHQRFETLW